MGERAARPRRAAQGGFTLIEVIASLAILTIISAAMMVIFVVGLKAVASPSVAPTGPQARLLGAHDLMLLEETLGQDGARAACVEVPGTAPAIYGSCTHVHTAGTCPSADLCFAWPVVSDDSCHLAAYTVGAGVTATRTEYKVGTASPLGAVPLATDVHVDITLGMPVTATPPGEAYQWLRALPVTVTASGFGSASGPSQTLTLQPVATDPAGANAAFTTGAPPC